MSWKYKYEDGEWYSKLDGDDNIFNHGREVSIVVSGFDDLFSIHKHGSKAKIVEYFDKIKVFDENAYRIK